MTEHYSLYRYFVQIILQKTIREGLLLSLPLVISGAAALVFCSIPIPAYQAALQNLWDGRLYAMMNGVFMYTFSILPLIFSFTMSFSFGKTVSNDWNEIFYYPLITFSSYLVFIDSPSVPMTEVFNTSQTFTAIMITITVCSLLHFLRRFRYFNLQHYWGDSSGLFVSASRMLLPCLLVLILFSAAGTLFPQDFKTWFLHLHLSLFQYIGNNLAGFAGYVFVEHFYWFFGIHGSNVLAGVTTAFWEPNMAENIAAQANGLLPQNIYTPSFLYAFIWMGGCGAVSCLLLSILFFSQSTHMRRLAKFSFLPCLFNISETIIIGLPVICNPIFIAPFLLVPLTCLATSSLAMSVGLVPVTTHATEWTTPILWSGYVTTGSYSGALLQLVNLGIGIMIYKPFIQRYEKTEKQSLYEKFNLLVDEVKNCESLGQTPSFHADKITGEVARMLAFDLRQAIKEHQLTLYYQPQIKYDGTLYGVEALLRWYHPRLGLIYPPLVIFLAKEEELLDELGLSLIESACRDLQEIEKNFPLSTKVSVNVAPQQLYSDAFCGEVSRLLQKYHFRNSILAFEITEQVALSVTSEVMERLHALKNMGVQLSMDDFGMGHSSVMYLQDSEFDVVKLDGSLIKKCLDGDRSETIIRAITELSRKFNFEVIAEFVETEEQREKLADLGCHIYQGWLYAPAIPLCDFIDYTKTLPKK